MKSVYTPQRQSKAKADISILECDDNSIMGGDISWGPKQYNHIEGIATEDPDKVSATASMTYDTYEERWSNTGENMWEIWPRNLRVVHPRGARGDATRHDLKYKHAARIDYI